MKVFFDTNVYVAEALLGGAAEQMIRSSFAARWRVFCSGHVLDEVQRVMTEKLGFSATFGRLTRERVRRRTILVTPPSSSRHDVPNDADDSPILAAALAAGADYLVTNDAHLLALNPYRGLRIISLTDYFDMLVNDGILKP